MAKQMKKKTAPKKKTNRTPRKDESQIALSVVERAIGGKLADAGTHRTVLRRGSSPTTISPDGE
jgi:hypothetical protein